MATAREKKKDFSQQLHNVCVCAVNADNLLGWLGGKWFQVVQTREHPRIPDRLADCWTFKQQQGLKLKRLCLFIYLFIFIPLPDCGCGFINLWLPSLSDMLHSCSMLDLSESDCTLSEETDHVGAIARCCSSLSSWSAACSIATLTVSRTPSRS